MERQLVIDCREPSRLVAFWAEALRYRPQPPPAGHTTWREWYLSLGIPAEELGEGDCVDRLEDPAGAGPRIWFQPRDEEVVRLKGLGRDPSTRIIASPNGPGWVTRADPEGNLFCVERSQEHHDPRQSSR